MVSEELIKDVVKFYTLRYVITLVVSRTITGQHKRAYIDLGLEGVFETVVDVLWDHRGEYLTTDEISFEVAKRLGFTFTRTKDAVRYPVPGRKKKASMKFDDFKRVVSYALSAMHTVFDLLEMVRRPARDVPERYVRPDRYAHVAARFNKVVERLMRNTIPKLESDGAYVCPNLHCPVIELYTRFEAEESDYRCAGKYVMKIEYGDSGSIQRARIQGCGSFLEDVDPEIFRKVARILNVIVERTSRRL